MPKLSFGERLSIAAKAAFEFSHLGVNTGYGTGSGWGAFGSLFSGRFANSAINFAAEGGPPHLNSVVAVCIGWIWDRFPEAQVKVEKKSAGGVWKEAPNHEALHLLEHPNTSYDDTTLWAGTTLSLALDGNAYWFLEKSAAGIVTGIYYIPHWQIYPFRALGKNEYVSGYKRWVDGHWKTESKEDILHFKRGIDPENELKGMSRTKAVLRPIFTDNEADTLCALILRNKGIPGAVIMPDNEEDEFKPDTRKQIRENWMERVSGDSRGEPYVFSRKIGLEFPSYSPNDLLLTSIQALPMAKIAASMSLNLMTIGYPDPNKTYANLREANDAACRGCLIPMYRLLSSQASHRLFVDPDRERIHFDVSQIQELQEDENDRHKRLRQDFLAGGLTLGEWREAIGQPSTEAEWEDKYYWQLPKPMQSALGKPAKAGSDPADPDNSEGE